MIPVTYNPRCFPGAHAGATLKLDATCNLAFETIPLQDFSRPPSGGRKVTNLYVDVNGKLVVEFDTTPVP